MKEEGVTGTVERVVFQNPDNGWCVLKVKVKGRRRLLSVVGHSVLVVPGETIEAEGEWTDHVEYGERFAATRLKTTLPRAASAAEKFLSSGFVRGIGEELARRMVEKFGAGVFEVIESSPDLLREVEGIGPSRANRIQEAWKEQRELREVMEFLGSRGLSPSFAPRILRAFGGDALNVLKNHPYRIALEVKGIGFASADHLARYAGLSRNSDERLAAALHDRLLAAVARGHCAYPADLLLNEAAREIDVAPSTLEPVLEGEIEAGRLTEDFLYGREGTGGRDGETLCVFPPALAMAERRLTEIFWGLSRGRPPWERRVPPVTKGRRDFLVIREVSEPAELSAGQNSALRKILASKISILTGGPGTGKTTLIRAVHRAVSHLGCRVVCCAPTGRAAQRLTEASGVEAQTVHRLLGFDPATGGFLHGESRPLDVDLLILDEASMVGLELMKDLAEALPREAALLLVGDIEQLPSIQAGRVLESMIESRVFAHVRLDEVFRQKGWKGESFIIKAAHEVIQGRTPNLKTLSPEQDFHFIEARDSTSCAEIIEKLVASRIPARFGLDPLRDIQVLCPMNKGETGARALNRRLQAILNPSPAESIERFGQKISVGDKVIVTANDYDKEVFNGDIGRLALIERDRSSLRVDFGQRRIDFGFSETDFLSLAFAITIHKAQGSEYEAVVIPLLEESAAMFSRQLLYTGITRGRRLVVIVGSSNALRRAVHSSRTERRWSGLARRLAESRGFAAEV